MSYHFLLDLALILLSTKLLGILTRKIQMPQVVGALLAGLILGPAMLNILSETAFLSQISELGVIVILFTAGLSTDIRELKATGKAGFFVALCGVLVPLVMGAALAWIAGRIGLVTTGSFMEDVFVGTVLTATSVSITVETLKELGKLNTKVGGTILAAALIDDVLGLIALTLVSSFAGEKENVWLVLAKIAMFFAFAIVVGGLAMRFFNWLVRRFDGKNLRRYPVLAFVLCLLMAYCAERFFGVADIIGAYAAGLVISCTPKAKYIESKFEPLSYLLLTPVFFASVGINADISGVNGKMLLFSVLLLAVAILSKLLGCGLGAKLCHFTTQECVQVGTGMACRGEVALIVANRGVAMGVLSKAMMTPVIITVVGCAILTPVLLKLSFHKERQAELEQNALADRLAETEQLDIVSEQLLQKNRDFMEKKTPEEKE
ncbi:MAG: cation:proton antiporter [Oscillibacter sp.]|nr:cation:proton antiporter [Oscillibacter sp.]